MKRWIAFAAAAFLIVAVSAALLVRPRAAGMPDGSPVRENVAVAPPGAGTVAEPALKLNVPKAASNDASAAASAGAEASNSLPARRQLIRNGSISLLVPDIEGALAAVRGLANGEAGYLSDLSDERPAGGGAARSASLDIAVPADRFDGTLERLAALGGVRSRSVSAQDVTDQLVDDGARLRNLRRTEADMLRIMDRSGRISDVLDVENQLSSVRDQIERLDAERASLAGRVAYASISVSLSTDAGAPVAEPSTRSRLAAAWGAALLDVREFSLALAARLFVLIAFAPYWALTAALLAAAGSAASFLRGRARARAA
jgi:hypothetical protein